MINCDRCGYNAVAEKNPEHSELLLGLLYENGYHNAGAKVICCQNEGCQYRDSTEIPAIFTCLGYSTNPDMTEIATGFSVNSESLDAYETFLGKKLSFGIAIFNPKYLEGDTFMTDGEINASNGCLQVELDLSYSICNLFVMGMSMQNPSHVSLELIFVGYACGEGDTSTAVLMQKDYVGTQENPILSPMASKVTKKDATLYTVKLGTVLAPVQLTTGKETLDEFTAK